MNIKEETDRKPDYYKDIEYGKVGEIDFLDVVKHHKCFKNLKCFDVREVREYQHVDIDFVLVDVSYKSDELPDIKEVIKNDFFKKVEVKLDSVATSTGRLPYEVVSHGHAGWCDITKCDIVYLVLTERDSDIIVKRAIVDMNKWREYCGDRKNKKKVSFLQKEEIVDLLCDLEDMRNKGVLCWFKK